MALDESNPDLDEHDGDIEEDEYAVEKIVDKRVDRKTGATEYLVKWENYDHSDNTWEPVEHLKCPDLILKFEEDRKKELKKAKELEKERPVKRRRSSNASQQESQSKRVRKEERQGTSNIKLNEPEVLLEEGIDDTEEEEEEEEEEDGSGKKKNDKSVKDDDTPSSSTETQSSLDGDNNLPKTGFARGLPIESIVGSCTDDDQNIGFFIKWKGADGMDLVDATEIEERAPRELCVWYRNRLYAAIKSNPPVKG